ncbi:MAG: trehalose-6-phosphate synthase [Dehalococcoidia bacterium]
MDRFAGLILANRAFVDHGSPPGAPEVTAPATEGGLLAAVRPIIATWDGDHGTTWIGAGCGPFDREFVDGRGFEIIPTAHGPLRHRRLFFSDETWHGHYRQTANGFLWPAMHIIELPLPDITAYFPRPQTPSPGAWAAYEQVNDAFAAAADATAAGEPVWIHDYQLALVPALLRDRGATVPIGFFLHTPFPAMSVLERVLDREGLARFERIVTGILGASLAGFQSEADAARFIDAAERLGATRAGDRLTFAGRETCVGAYPVGIDADELLAVARAAGPITLFEPPAIPVPLVVGLERADYTKGIPERLAAVRRAYDAGVAFTYAGVAAPTREGVAAYERLASDVETAAAEAARAARAHGRVFTHVHRNLPWVEVVGLQRDADVIFTSSLADGMNLVPLQSAIAQSLKPMGERAVIVTGKGAGVAAAFAGFEQDGLVTVDPLDPAAMDATLRAAVAGELPQVSDRLIAAVRSRDARAWATRFLTDLEEIRC